MTSGTLPQWDYDEVFVRITPDQAIWVRGGLTMVVAAQEGATPRTILTKQLMAMGDEGWEMVGVVNDDVTEVEEGQGFRFYFKRPRVSLPRGQHAD